MTVITPFFDVVAGVAILAGRSSLLDTGVFKTANTNFTIRHLLALGFIGVGVWNLWKIERAQDKLKKSLGAESYDFSWVDVKEMTDAKCPFCKKSSFRINNEDGYSFGLHEEDLAGDFWLLECANCGAEWNQGGESTLDRMDLLGAEPMFVESDSLMVELMGFDGSYRTDGEVKVGYTTAAELGFEPKELKPVMWVWDDIEGYGAFMPTEKIRFIAEYFE